MSALPTAPTLVIEEGVPYTGIYGISEEQRVLRALQPGQSTVMTAKRAAVTMHMQVAKREAPGTVLRSARLTDPDPDTGVAKYRVWRVS